VSDKACGRFSARAKLLKHDTTTNAPNSDKILRILVPPVTMSKLLSMTPYAKEQFIVARRYFYRSPRERPCCSLAIPVAAATVAGKIKTGRVILQCDAQTIKFVSFSTFF
jgi:hypothetical protein